VTFLVFICIEKSQYLSSAANNALSDLMDQLQEEFADTLPEDDVLWEKGMAVTAQFSEDMMWYRAEIVEVDARGLQVLIVLFCLHSLPLPLRILLQGEFMMSS
jgi:hypothetical protein